MMAKLFQRKGSSSTVRAFKQNYFRLTPFVAVWYYFYPSESISYLFLIQNIFPFFTIPTGNMSQGL